MSNSVTHFNFGTVSGTISVSCPNLCCLHSLVFYLSRDGQAGVCMGALIPDYLAIITYHIVLRGIMTFFS